LSRLAEQKKQDALTNKCTAIPGVRDACAFTLEFLNKSTDILKQVNQTEQQKYTQNATPGTSNTSKNDWLSFLAGMGASLAYGPILNFTQSLWTSFLEMAMWLSALFAPLFIASSLIPGRQNLTVAWLISFLTIGLAKLAYVIVIGIVSVQLTDQQAQFGYDLRFPLALGLFAPGVSLAVIAGGGLAAASSFRSQSVAVIGVTTNIVTGAVGTLGYSLARYSDKNR